MITQEMIEAVKLELDTKIIPLKIVLKAAQDAFDAEAEILTMPIREMLEQYGDEQCIDKNNLPVRVRDIMSDGKNDYVVTKRGMQSLFGIMLFNSRIICKKINSDMSLNPKAKDKDVNASELKNYTIISSVCSL